MGDGPPITSPDSEYVGFSVWVSAYRADPGGTPGTDGESGEPAHIERVIVDAWYAGEHLDVSGAAAEVRRADGRGPILPSPLRDELSSIDPRCGHRRIVPVPAPSYTRCL